MSSRQKRYIRYKAKLTRRGYLLISRERWNSNMKLQQEIYRLNTLVREKERAKEVAVIKGPGVLETVLSVLHRLEDTVRIQNDLYGSVNDRLDALEKEEMSDCCHDDLSHQWVRDPEQRGEGLVCSVCWISEAEMEGDSEEV